MAYFMELMMKIMSFVLQYWWVLLIIIVVICVVKAFGSGGSGGGGGGGDGFFCTGNADGRLRFQIGALHIDH